MNRRLFTILCSFFILIAALPQHALAQAAATRAETGNRSYLLDLGGELSKAKIDQVITGMQQQQGVLFFSSKRQRHSTKTFFRLISRTYLTQAQIQTMLDAYTVHIQSMAVADTPAGEAFLAAHN